MKGTKQFVRGLREIGRRSGTCRNGSTESVMTLVTLVDEKTKSIRLRAEVSEFQHFTEPDDLPFLLVGLAEGLAGWPGNEEDPGWDLILSSLKKWAIQFDD